MAALKDLTGLIFGRLTVIRRADRDTRNRIQWLCQCSCLARTRMIVCGDNLRSHSVRSCGCLCREIASAWMTEFNRRRYEGPA
jgi:hypothetical protein